MPIAESSSTAGKYGRVQVDRLQVGLAVELVELGHPVDVAPLLREAPHDPHPAEALLQVGRHLRDPLSRDPVGARRDDPEDQARDRQQRQRQEDDQRQLDIGDQHDHHDPDQGQGAGEEGDDAGADQLVESVDVIGDPRDQHARPVSGEESDRHLLEVREDPDPQVLQRPLPDPADQVGLQIRGAPADQRRAEEAATISSSAACVVGQGRRDRLADQEGRSQRRDRGEDQRAEHHQHLAPVRPQQREQPLDLPPAVVLAADEPPERPEEQKNVLGAVRLVHSFASSSRSSRSRCR